MLKNVKIIMKLNASISIKDIGETTMGNVDITTKIKFRLFRGKGIMSLT